MRLEQFEYFIEIANSKSISIAAENLFISQPALSRSIKALEEELGVTLFYRTVDGMRLTKAGQELYPEMKEIIDRTIALSKHAASFAKTCPDEDFEGPFHIYTLPVLIDSLLMPTLEQLHHDYPDLDPHMHQLDLGEPLSLKIPEDADMILSVNVGNILDQDIADSGWHLEQLFIGNSFLVVSKHHPLAGKKIPPRGSGTKADHPSQRVPCGAALSGAGTTASGHRIEEQQHPRHHTNTDEQPISTADQQSSAADGLLGQSRSGCHSD